MYTEIEYRFRDAASIYVSIYTALIAYGSGKWAAGCDDEIGGPSSRAEHTQTAVLEQTEKERRPARGTLLSHNKIALSVIKR